MGIFDRLFGSKKSQPSRGTRSLLAKPSAESSKEPDGQVKSFRDYPSFRSALDQCQQGCAASEWSGHLRASADIDNKIRDIFSRRPGIVAGGDDSWIDLIWHKNDPTRLKRIDGKVKPAAIDFTASEPLWSDPSSEAGRSAPPEDSTAKSKSYKLGDRIRFTKGDPAKTAYAGTEIIIEFGKFGTVVGFEGSLPIVRWDDGRYRIFRGVKDTPTGLEFTDWGDTPVQGFEDSIHPNRIEPV